MSSISGLELHEASSLGDYDSLEDYLKSGRYDVNMKDPEWHDRAPIHWACSKGYVDCMRLLLEYGAKPTARMSMGWTPAHCAAEAGKLNILRALHNAGHPIGKKDKYGDTPRRVADMYGHMECVKYLEQAEEESRERKEADQQQDSDSEEITDDDNT